VIELALPRTPCRYWNMPRVPIVVVLVTALTVPAARGDGTTQPPADAKPRIGAYSDLALGAGFIELVDTVGSGDQVSDRVSLVSIHHAAGIVIRRPDGPHIRLGGALDLFRGSFDTIRWGTAYGPEVQADWLVPNGWRLGGRASITYGTAKPFRRGDEGPFRDVFLTTGVRARFDFLTLGADVIVPLDNASGTGAIFSAGYAGRPAFASVAVTLIVLFVLGVGTNISS